MRWLAVGASVAAALAARLAASVRWAAVVTRASVWSMREFIMAILSSTH